MKKKIMSFLTLVISMQLIACGGGNTTSTSSANVAGEYKNVGILMNENVTYQLHDDETVDKKADIKEWNFKGLYEKTKDGFTLKANKSSVSENFVREGDYLYKTDGGITYFDNDDDYGKTITLDDNGRTDQSFQTYYCEINKGSTGSSTYYVLSIVFHKDGTFELYKFYHDISGWNTTDREEFKGTYSANDDIITLNYNNADHILLIIGDKLYFDVIQKTD